MSYEHLTMRASDAILCLVFFSAVVGIAVFFPSTRLPIECWLLIVALCCRPLPGAELAR